MEARCFGNQRSQTIAPMTRATTKSAPRTYLLAANQDSEGNAELRNGAALSELGESVGMSPATSETGTSESDAAEDDAMGSCGETISSTVADSIGREVKFCGVVVAVGAGTSAVLEESLTRVL